MGRQSQVNGANGEASGARTDRFAISTISTLAMLAALGVGPGWQAWNAYEAKSGMMTLAVIITAGIVGLTIAYAVTKVIFRATHRSHQTANAAFTVMMLLGLSGSLMAGAMREAGVWDNWSTLVGPKTARAEQLPKAGEIAAMPDETPVMVALPEPRPQSNPEAEPAPTANTEAEATDDDFRDVGISNAQELLAQAAKASPSDPAAARKALLKALSPLVRQLKRATVEHREAFTAMLQAHREVTRAALDQRLTQIRRAMQTNRALDTIYQKAPGLLSDALAKSRVPQNTITTLVEAAFPDDRIDKTTDLRLVQQELCVALEAESRVLLTHWGKWSVEKRGEKSVLRFRNAEDAQLHQRAVQDVQTQLEKQQSIIDDMRAATGR